MKRRRTILTMLGMLLILVMSAQAFAAGGLTSKQAVAKAIKDAGVAGSDVIRLETEKENGRFEIEFVNKRNSASYEYEISASSGRILERSIDYAYRRNASKDKVGKTQARKNAAKAAGIRYSAIKNCVCTYEYDAKEKEGTYEVKFKNGNYRYEIEILAPTGKVIEFDMEYRKK